MSWIQIAFSLATVETETATEFEIEGATAETEILILILIEMSGVLPIAKAATEIGIEIASIPTCGAEWALVNCEQSHRFYQDCLDLVPHR